MDDYYSSKLVSQARLDSEAKWLFWGSFIALVATAFGFIVRTQVINEWGIQFNLSETQKGELFGVGLWPFALSIVLFSLVVDRVGYGKAMVFAFGCHMASAIITILAQGYWGLYIGTFIVALGNGTVEAVVNPVVATMFPKDKTKWLNILHAGWPGGLVLGGMLALMMGSVDWRLKVALIFLPTAVYGLMLFGRRFPVQERVQAGVPYKVMLQEAGILGVLIVVALIVSEVGRVFSWPLSLQLSLGAVLVAGYTVYVRAWGRMMFFFLLLLMIPLATTELGTDSWITALMAPEMGQLGIHPGWVLVYTSLIMMILRFFSGPFVHKLSPLGLLAASSLVAAVGLVALSKSTGVMILLAATLYGFGKTFFWPTMLGVVSEQFPKGGALTLNAIAAVGTLSVGVVGAAFLGYVQDRTIDQELRLKDPVLHTRVLAQERVSVFGKYHPLDQDKLELISLANQRVVEEIQADAKKDALMVVAILPIIMLGGYSILILYFRGRGGYQAAQLLDQTTKG